MNSCIQTATPRVVRVLIVGAVATLLSACGSTRLMYAHFNSDTPGRPPDPNLPGPPTGDRIRGRHHGDVRVAVVVEDLTLRTPSLRFSNAEVTLPYLAFHARSVSSTSRELFAFWAGRVEEGPIDLQVLFGDQLAPIVGMRFRDGEVLLEPAIGTFEPLGPYRTDLTHVVVFELDRRTGLCAVRFLQGANTVVRTGIPAISRAGVETTQPILGWSYSSPATGGRYLMDDVTISERPPPDSMMGP